MKIISFNFSFFFLFWWSKLFFFFREEALYYHKCNIYTCNIIPGLWLVNLLKVNAFTGVFQPFFLLFKNIYFKEHLFMCASIFSRKWLWNDKQSLKICFLGFLGIFRTLFIYFLWGKKVRFLASKSHVSYFALNLLVLHVVKRQQKYNSLYKLVRDLILTLNLSICNY